MHGVLLVLASVGLLVGCVSVPIEEEDAFDPRRTVHPATYERPGATLEPRQVPGGDPDVELSAWWLQVDDAAATVLLFGGRDFHLVQSAGYLRTFEDLGVNALLVDYRGYGDSGGDPTVEGLLADAREAHRYLIDELGVTERDVIVHGHSVGAVPALHLAAAVPVGGVALENPLTRAEDWRRALMPWYVRAFVRLDFDPALAGVDNLEQARQLQEPVFIAAGDADRLVPAELAERLHDEAGSEHRELVILEGGGHNDLHRYPDYREGYRRLVDRVGAGSGGP